MDKVTVKVMSHSCKMADITDQEISCEHNFIIVVRFFFWFPNWGVFPVLRIYMSLLGPIQKTYVSIFLSLSIFDDKVPP